MTTKRPDEPNHSAAATRFDQSRRFVVICLGAVDDLAIHSYHNGAAIHFARFDQETETHVWEG
jgi:hypothetical protein